MTHTWNLLVGLSAAALTFGCSSVTYDTLPMTTASNAKLAGACTTYEALLAHRPDGSLGAKHLMDAEDCAANYALSRTDLPADQQIALLVRAEQGALLVQPNPARSLEAARKIADRLAIVLRDSGAIEASIQAAARATWYEQRARDPEVVRQSADMEKMAAQDETDYLEQVSAQRRADEAATLGGIAAVSSAVASYAGQAASSSAQTDPKAAQAFNDVKVAADKLAAAARVAQSMTLDKMPSAADMKDLLGNASFDQFAAFVTADDGTKGKMLVDAFSQRLGQMAVPHSPTWDNVVGTFLQNKDTKVEVDAFAGLLGVQPVYREVADKAEKTVASTLAPSAPVASAPVGASAPAPPPAASPAPAPAGSLRPDKPEGAGFYCMGMPNLPDGFSCSRSDCAQIAATTAAQVPGFTCVEKPSAYCFSMTIGGSIKHSVCTTALTTCEAMLPAYEKQSNVIITARCQETR